MYAIAKVLKVLLLFIFVCLLLPSFGLSDENILTIDEDLEIDRQLKLLNKPPIKTIVDDGDIYDCVDIYRQWAFDHPSLKNHKIQVSSSTSLMSTLFDDDISSSANGTSIEIGLKDGNTCPTGTVPIRRISKDDLIGMRSSFKNTKMNPPVTNDETHVQQPAVHITKKEALIDFYGVSAYIIVYGLPQVMQRQSSSSLTWLVNNVEKDQINTISVGWTVSPVAYGDNKTRLTASWTNDNFQKTGCQDTSCQGFVQICKKLPLGIAIKPLSTYGGKQYGLNIVVFRDPESKNWWFFLGKNREPIGYWPNELFTSMTYASLIHFGGLVGYLENSKKPPMGSGHFPIEGTNKSCFFSNIRYVNEQNNMQELKLGLLSPHSSLQKCYFVGSYFREGGDFGNMFFFGGPGNCT